RASRCRAPRPSRTTRTACWSMSCRTSTRAGRTPAAKAASGSPGRTRDGSWCGSPPTRSPPAGRAHKPSARPPRLRRRLRPLWLLQSRDPLLRLRSQGARQGDEHVSEVATAIRPYARPATSVSSRINLRLASIGSPGGAQRVALGEKFRLTSAASPKNCYRNCHPARPSRRSAVRGCGGPLLGPTVKLAPAPRRTRSDPIHVVSDPRVGEERRLAQRQRIKLWAVTTVHKAEALPLHPGMVFEMVLDH